MVEIIDPCASDVEGLVPPQAHRSEAEPGT